MRVMRSQSAAPRRPIRSDRRQAVARPAATEWPWGIPAAASTPWPTLWPRLSFRRSPDSRSSRSTIPALSSTEPATSRFSAAVSGRRALRRDALDELEIGAARQYRAFDRLGHARCELDVREGCEKGDVHRHEARLREAAHEVLHSAEVHAVLSSDRGVHHRQEGRGSEAEIDAPQPGRGREAGKVGYGASPDRQDEAVASERAVQECAVESLERGEGLGRLPALDFDHWAGREGLAVDATDQAIGDDDRLGGIDGR